MITASGRRVHIMNTQENNKNKKLKKNGMNGKKKIALFVTVIVVIIIFMFLFRGKGTSEEAFTTVKVKRGNLAIDVLESGNVEASKALEIKSEVEGRTTIISIAPEGTLVTEEDVKNKKVLVELDSSELEQKLIQQEISVQSAEADYTDATESYKIQINKNESDRKTGELKVKFARMDLEKYLGLEAASAFTSSTIELENLFECCDLGGEALQKKREHESNISLNEEEVARAEEKLVWTRKLEEKGYVTHNELQADDLSLKTKKVGLDKSRTAYDLFKRFEFQKQAEKLRSDYEEAKKELERIIARNRSELARAESKKKSSEANLTRKQEELDKIKEQLEKSKIVATQPGLLIYGGSRNTSRWGRSRIAEGEQVHERQNIAHIPDTSTMIASIKVHESMVSRVKEGQKCEITVDAIPDVMLMGKVKMVSPVADSEQRWLNPNLKVYVTEVSIDGNHPNLKPGMSVEVRILIDELKDVLTVPLQAVTTHGDDSICFVLNSSNPEKRVLKTGEYNDKFIEIKEGLEEGEDVILNIGSLVAELEPAEVTEKKPKIIVAAEDSSTSPTATKSDDAVSTAPKEGERPEWQRGERRRGERPQGRRPRGERSGRQGSSTGRSGRSGRPG
jgi:HlyD family secretion protein